MTDKEKAAIDPRAIVLDLVLRWSDKMGESGTAMVRPGGDGAPGSLIFCATNHREQRAMGSVPIHFDGAAVDGPAPRFVLYRLAASVWKLSPSVLTENLHAYLTIVGAPEAVGIATMINRGSPT